MKKLIWLLLLGLGFAQTTPNLHLNVPPTGQLNWGPTVNANFSSLDSYLSGITPLPKKVIFSSTIQVGSVTFSTIPTVVNGSMVYCSDCQQVNPCASGGTGALAQGVNGQWQCSQGAGGTFSGNASSIQGTAVDPSSPSINDVFSFNGTTWSHIQPIWMPLNGGSMTGLLTLSGDPSSALQAATKQYVDNHSGSGGGAGAGACSSQVVTALNLGSGPTCAKVSSSLVDTSIEQIANKNIANGYVGLDSTQSATLGGSLTVGNLLNIPGSFWLTSPCPATAPPVPALGLSAWGFDSDCLLHGYSGSGGQVGVEFVYAHQLGIVTAGHIAAFDANANIIDGGTAGAGNVNASALTTNTFPKATASTTIANSLLTDDATTLTYSGTGGISTAGNMNMSGASPILSSSASNANIQLSPNGTGSVIIPAGSSTDGALRFNGDSAGSGFGFVGAGAWGYTNGAAYKLSFNSAGLRQQSGAGFSWTAGANSATSQDTGIARLSAGVTSFDTSTVGNGLGKASAAGYLTTTNCAAVGTGANPSLVACSAAPSGAFSCATAASTGTCVVSTTAVSANSNIIVQQVSYLSTRLSVTCNTASALPSGPLVTSLSLGTSFTITLGTVTTNPACFVYWIVN